jgi:hypothetical protein
MNLIPKEMVMQLADSSVSVFSHDQEAQVNLGGTA